MANKSKKNKNYQALKDNGQNKKKVIRGNASNKATNSFGFGLDPETGKIKNIRFVTIIIVAAVMLFVGVRIWANYQAAGYSGTAKPYMAEVLPKISTWDADVLKSYMAPETMANISEYDFNSMMISLKKLGPLISMEEPEFQTVNTVKSREGVESTIVSYTIDAKYVNGDADLIMVLKQQGDSYEVYRFNVDSKVLSQ